MSQKQTYSQTVKSGLFSNTVSQTTSTYGATGEFFSQYRGATLGYSLRNLSNKTKSVVRVRRDSDNIERDFSASEINDGSLENWVNNQAVRPLDIQEMVGGERTGNKLPVKGAYSLRRLSGSYTGPVVEVRDWRGYRKDFNALEVTDGTMEAWTLRRSAEFNNKSMYFQPGPHFVRAPIGRAFGGTNWGLKFKFIWTASGSNTRHGLIGNARTPVVFFEGSTLKVTGWTGSTQVEHDLGVSILPHGPYEVELNYNAATTTLTGTLTDLYEGTVTEFNTITNYDAHYSLPDDYIDIGVATGDITRFYGSIKDVEISINGIVRHKYAGYGNTNNDWVDTVGGANGIIQGAGQPYLFNGQHIHAVATKLYDQSGNNRHMVGVALANPEHPDPNDREWNTVQDGALICNSGKLYRDAEGNPRVNFAPWSSYRSRYKIDFGADQSNTDQTVVMVHQAINTKWNRIIDDFDSTGERMLLDTDGSSNYRMNSISTNHQATTNQSVFVARYGGSSNLDDYGRLNGVSSGPFHATTGSLPAQLAVGYSVRSSPDNAYEGYMSELIFYGSLTDSDVEAIEANIADTYGISNIPTGGDQANGYVSVWYDQSFSNHDMVQTVQTRQPWIVKDGLLTKNSNGLPAIQFENAKFLYASAASARGEDGSAPFIKKDNYFTAIYSMEIVRPINWTWDSVNYPTFSGWIWVSYFTATTNQGGTSVSPYFDRQGNERILRTFLGINHDEAVKRSMTISSKMFGGNDSYIGGETYGIPTVNTVMYKPRDGGPYDSSEQVQEFTVRIGNTPAATADELGAHNLAFTKSGDVWVNGDYTISLTNGRWSLSKNSTELMYAVNPAQYPWKIETISWKNDRDNSVKPYQIDSLNDGAGNKVWGRDAAKLVSWSTNHPNGSDVSVSTSFNSLGEGLSDYVNTLNIGHIHLAGDGYALESIEDHGEWNMSEMVFFPEALDSSVQSMKANVENYYKV